VPSDADAGRGALFRSYLRGRPAVYALVFPSTVAFTVGAWKRESEIMAGGPLAIAALVLLIAFVIADRTAEQRFFTHFAASLGLALYGSRAALMPLTPLLGAGDRRWCENWMQGRLRGRPALAGGLGHFVWEARRGTADAHDKIGQRHRFTVCVVDLEGSMPLFRGVFLRPRRGLFPPHGDWLARTPTRRIELESAVFTQRYELLIADDHDESAVRQLLSPTLVRWLAEHTLSLGFELRAGTLVAFVERPLTDAGNLTFLIDATRRLAARVVREVDEAAGRPAA
jgi:hypothetical protein